MSRTTLAASFASLMGYGSKAKGAKSEDEKDKDAKGAKSEDEKDDKDKDAKGAKADDDGDDGSSDAKGAKSEDEKDDKDKGAKGAKADDEEDDDAAEGDDADGDDDKEEKSKKAAKAERKRCARIVAHGFKCGRAEQAAVFAFDTGMSSAAAISALNAAASVQGSTAKGSGLRERMGAETPPKKVEATSASGAQTTAEKILAAGRKRRGEQ